MTAMGSKRHFPNHLVTFPPKISSRQQMLPQAPSDVGNHKPLRCPVSCIAVAEWNHSPLKQGPTSTPRPSEMWDPGALSTAGSLPCAKCLRSASSTAGKPSGRIFHTVLLFWIRTQLPPELFKFTGLRSELSTQAAACIDKGLSREHWVPRLSKNSLGPIADQIPASINQKMTL